MSSWENDMKEIKEDMMIYVYAKGLEKKLYT